MGIISQDSLVKKTGKETITCFSVFINQPNKEVVGMKCAFWNDDNQKRELWKLLRRGKIVDLVLSVDEQAKIEVDGKKFAFVESIEIIERKEQGWSNVV